MATTTQTAQRHMVSPFARERERVAYWTRQALASLSAGAALMVATLMLAACGGGGGSAGVTLTITDQPQSVTVVDGGTANFAVVATGASSLSYKWMKNGAVLSTGASNQLSIDAAYADNGTRYSVVVSSADGATATSTEALLTVTPIPVTITVQPLGLVEVTSGQNVTLAVEGSGTGPIGYQWSRNGLAIAGATTSTYVLAGASAADNGAHFTVSLANPGRSVTSDETTLVVTSVVQAPVVATDPPPLTVVTAGQTATLTVAGTGATAIQWNRDDAPIAGATGSSYTTPPLTAQDDGARFNATLTNSAGSTPSGATTIHVNVPAGISAQPASASVYEGQVATFAVTASGTGPFSYQWMLGGSAIAGATSSTYSTGPLSLASSGTGYSVTVRNLLATATSGVATVTVLAQPSAPAITAQPSNAVTRVGGQATYVVSATGSAPLTYQWFKNGVLIAGASSPTYTTPPVTTADDGATFAAKASNGTGTVATSSAASLRVLQGVAQLATGHFHSLAVTDDGAVWGWGNGQSGQLGVDVDGFTAGVPIRAKGADGSAFGDVKSVAGGLDHTVAMRADGTVWAWGNGIYGALGDGVVSGHIAVRAVQVTDSSGGSFKGAASVAAGAYFSLATKTVDGSVWAWGYNRYGKLGDSTVANRGTAAPVLLASGVPLTGVTKVAAGGDHALAIKEGNVLAWGDNTNGDLGNGTLTWSGAPVLVETDPGVPLAGVVDVAAGTYHSVALTGDGQAYSWGTNTAGALGDGTTNRRTRAVQVKDGAGNVLSGIKAIAAGDNCTVFLMRDGTVWMSGDNTYGQQGGGSVGIAFQLSAKAVLLVGGGQAMSGVTQIAMTLNHVLVRTTDGNVWAWGYDNAFQLGNPTRTSPIQGIPAKVGGI